MAVAQSFIDRQRARAEQARGLMESRTLSVAEQNAGIRSGFGYLGDRLAQNIHAKSHGYSTADALRKLAGNVQMSQAGRVGSAPRGGSGSDDPLERLADTFLAALQSQGGASVGEQEPYVVVGDSGGGGGMGMGTLLVLGALGVGGYFLYKRYAQ